MKKNLILLMALCLFTLYACQQESISPTLVDQHYELTDNRNEAPCDLTQIPLYIPPASTVPNGTIDFSAVFPVTESTDYETANGVNLTVQSVSYSVNNSPLLSPQYTYLSNTNYLLTVDVTYTNGVLIGVKTFSVTFNVSNGQALGWGRTNSCLYEIGPVEEGGKNNIYLKTIQAVILPEL